MDKVTALQQEQIKKTSSERLTVKLIKAGVDEETVYKMDRAALMNQWAELVVTGKDQPTAAAAGGVKTLQYDPEAEKIRIKVEQEKMAQRAEQITQKAAEIAQRERELNLRAEENALKTKMAAEENALKTKIAAEENALKTKMAADENALKIKLAAEEKSLKISENERLAAETLQI